MCTLSLFAPSKPSKQQTHRWMMSPCCSSQMSRPNTHPHGGAQHPVEPISRTTNADLLNGSLTKAPRLDEEFVVMTISGRVL